LAGTERICPTCKQSFFDEARVCPHDGGKLVVVSAAELNRAGEVIDDKVTLMEVLGRGGMGTVYRGMQHSMQREVAVKVLRRSFSEDATGVRRFLHEATSVSKLNHPNVITLYDFGQTDAEELYLMMELLHGCELSDVLARSGPLPWRRAVGIAAQACEALHHAHQAGLVHRDLKPANIYLVQQRSRELAKVLDFGIAKMRETQGIESITRTGVVCGTPAYMSPEQVMGLDIDGVSDVYAVGVVLFEMLTGRTPFAEATPVQLMMAHLNDPPPALQDVAPDHDVPPEVEAVVMRCLSKDPSDRHPTAGELADALQELLDGRPHTPVIVDTAPYEAQEPKQPSAPDTEAGLARLPEPEERTPGAPPSRHGWVAAGAAVIAATVWLAWPSPTPAPTDAPEKAAAPTLTRSPSPTVRERPRAAARASSKARARAERWREQFRVRPRPAGDSKATADPAMVRIITTPPGARILVNGTFIGRSPVEVLKPAGSMSLQVLTKLRGYRRHGAVIRSEQEGDLHLTLRKLRSQRTGNKSAGVIK